VEVLGEVLSSLVERGHEAGVAMSPSVYGFAGDVGGLGSFGVGRAREQRLERLLLPWGNGRPRRCMVVGRLVGSFVA
jgi:hypothetical protein